PDHPQRRGGRLPSRTRTNRRLRSRPPRRDPKPAARSASARSRARLPGLARRPRQRWKSLMQGHIRKRVHTTKDGTQTVNWYVVIDLPRDANGKRRQKWHGGFHTRKEAEAARAKIVHEFNTGTYVEPTATTL